VETVPRGKASGLLCTASLLGPRRDLARQPRCALSLSTGSGGFDLQFSKCRLGFLDPRSQTTPFAAIDELLVRYRTAPGQYEQRYWPPRSGHFAVLTGFFAGTVAIRCRAANGDSDHWMIASVSHRRAGRLGRGEQLAQ
jgi:hypothetical protein